MVYQAQKKKRMGLTVYTGGTFDLFHYGHVNLLRRCSELGRVVVSLNTDEFIYEYKKIKPVCDYEERRAVLLSCRYVDDVIPNVGGSDSKQAICSVDADIIAIGSDWARKDYYTQMGFTQNWLDEKGISLIYIPYTPKISSTLIKTKI